MKRHQTNSLLDLLASDDSGELNETDAARHETRRALLRAAWHAPEDVSEAFNQRMLLSYQNLNAGNEVNENTSLSTNNAAAASILTAQAAATPHNSDVPLFNTDNSLVNLESKQHTNLYEEAKMKYCPHCQQEFADKFSFCPSDGTPLTETSVATEIGQVATTTTTNTTGRNDAAVNSASYAAGINGGAASEPLAFSPTDIRVKRSATSAAAAAANNAHSVENTTTTNGAPPDNIATVAGTLGASAAAANTSSSVTARGAYHLTIIEDASLANRLTKEIREIAAASRLTYPEFKRDPLGFTKRTFIGFGTYAWNAFKQPNVAIGSVAGLFVVLLVVAAIITASTMKRAPETAEKIREDIEYVGEVQDIPPDEPEKPKPDEAIGDSNAGGRVGFRDKSRGEGSEPTPKKATGGGGGGREESEPPSKGVVPPASEQQQIVTPKPEIPKIKNPTLPVAVVSKGDPLLFPERVTGPFGDPNSRSNKPSSGPGRGDGIGVGDGNNIGEGEGGGYGRGRGGNMGGGDFAGNGGGGAGGGRGSNGAKPPEKSVYSAREVTSKAVILSTLEAPYTEEARKNQIQGTVRLRAVLGANGQITGIAPVSGLPYGLTEQAIAVARKITFKPATKDGRPVSQYVTLAFQFNMY